MFINIISSSWTEDDNNKVLAMFVLKHFLIQVQQSLIDYHKDTMADAWSF